MQQDLLEIPEPGSPIVLDPPDGSDQVGDPGLIRLMRTDRMPVGRRGQLRTLRRQLVWCDHAVRAAQREAVRAMRDESLTESQRWDAVRRQRTLAWKVCREVLPLLSKVPPQLHAEPEYIDCQRAAHVLRRTTESVLRDNANFTVDLISASGTSPSTWTRD